jgi:Tfp pilus tip-associated adhesin PilY1
MRPYLFANLFGSTSAFCLALLGSSSSVALDIPDSPLFLTSTGVKPNLILTLDDSGSMRRGWIPEAVVNSQTTIDGPRFKSPSANGMYYNPRLTYTTPTRSDGTSYTTTFSSAYFNGFDTSKGSGINLGTSYKVVGQATPSHSYSDCTNTLTTTNNTDCRLVNNPGTTTTTANSATGCSVTFARVTSGRTTTNTITSSGSASCPSVFASIPVGTKVTIAGSLYTVTRAVTSGSINVSETLTNRTVSNAAVSWSYTTTTNPTVAAVAAYYYLFYSDKPGATKPSNCDDSRANDHCYIKVDVGSSGDIAAGTTDEKKQNFANWYSFYRTRALAAMSGAMSAINALTTDSVRLGWQTINKCTTFGSDCDGYTSTNSENRIRPLTAARKTTFSNWLQRFLVDGSTPLRSAVKRAGDYFSTSGVNSPYAEDPYTSDGTEYSCRKNFNIIFTDGLWNEDSSFTVPGTNTNPDSSGTTALPDGLTYSPVAPFKDVSVTTSTAYTNVNSVADTAFYYWAKDLNSSLSNNVPAYMASVSGSAATQYWNPQNDPATWQHMTNYAIGLGLSASLVHDCYYNPDTPTADPNNPTPGCPAWGGNTFAGDYQGLANGTLNWPRINTTPTLNSEPDGHVYDLWHAAINSRGKFYSADDPVALVAAFKDIMNTISAIADAGGGAGLSSNTTQIDEEGAVVFEAKFNSDWSGRLLARSVATDYELGTIRWDAGQKIPAPVDRKIFTLNGTPQPFSVAQCTGALGTALSKNGAGTVDTVSQCSKRLSWLRGDGKVTGATNSGYNGTTGTVTATFTVRGHGFVVGDLVTVSDVVVADNPAPAFGYNGSFQVTQVGGTDSFTVTAKSSSQGLGTYASGGRVRYTQFRNRANSMLGDIMGSDPIYVSTDNYGYGGGSVTLNGHGEYTTYVDGKSSLPPVIYVGANDGMLHAFRADVGNTQSGAELFAYVPRNVYDNLSKLPEPSYAHRYFVDGPVGAGDAYVGGHWRTFLVGGLGGGGKSVYALDVTDPTVFSTGNLADLATGLVKWEYSDSADLGLTFGKPQIAPLTASTWGVFFGNGYNSTGGKAYLYVVDLTNSANVTKIATNADTANGLATPYLYDSVDADKIPDVAYAGDLKGHLWKFVNQSGTWKLGNNGYPLFTALNASGVAQPITVQPKVGIHPNGGVLVYFGTGSYLATSDLTNYDTQTFYAIWDKNDGTTATRSLLRADLQGHSIQTETAASGYTVRTTSDEPVNWATKRGWYLDLPAGSTTSPTERIVSPAILMEFSAITVPDRVLFVTNKPSSDPCSRGGTTWLMELDLVSGGRTKSTDPEKLSVFDLNRDKGFTTADLVNVSGTPTQASGVALPSSYGITGEPLLLTTKTGDVVKEFSGSTGASGTAGGPLQQGEPPAPGGGKVLTPERVNWRQVL